MENMFDSMEFYTEIVHLEKKIQNIMLVSKICQN